MIKMIEQAIQIIDSIKTNIKIEEKYKNNLTQLIKDKYPQIQESIDNEGYIIEYQEYENFNEIIQEDKCIGFFTTQTITEEQMTIIINECYITQEKRGEKILKNLLFTIKTYPDIDIMLRNPTRDLIKSLTYAGLALPLNDGIIHSTIKLIDNNDNIIYTEDKKDAEEEYTTQLYDTNNSTMIQYTDNKISISKPRKNEIKKYKLEEKLKKIDKEYLNNIRLLVLEYKHHIDTLEFLFYYKQLDLLTVDNIIGTKDRLNQNIIEQLNKYDKSIDEGFKIRDKIIEALNKNEITQLTIYNRFMYLLENEEKEENDKINSCPECKKTYKPQFKYCHNCGYNIYRQDLKEEVDKLLDDLNPLDIFDENTKLELKFQRKIKKEGYEPIEVYQDQLEISSYQFLEYLDQNPNYIALAPFELLNHVKPESVIEKLLEKKLIEKKLNPDYEENYLEQYPQLEQLPTKNHVDKYIYKIKRKGRRYYKKNNIAAIFTQYLFGLDYYQFKRYIENSDTSDVQLLINEYTLKKLKEAIRYDDYELYTKLVSLDTQRLLKIDEKLLATTIIKAIICSLNTFSLKKEVTIKDEPIKIEIIAQYIQFKEMIAKYDIEELYNNAYDGIQINKLRINKQENKKIIRKLDDELLEINKQLTLEKIGIEE